MKRAERLKDERQFAARQEEFLGHIESLLADEFHGKWTPALAKACYKRIRHASEQEKTDKMKQALRFIEKWKTDLRIKVLRDLARYLRINGSMLKGNDGEWMEQKCLTIWTSFVESITEEHYFQFFAIACDDSDNLDGWRAPLWLAKAMGISEQEVSLEETPEEPVVVFEGGLGPRPLAICARLDSEHTDKLVKRAYSIDRTSAQIENQIGCLGIPERAAIDALCVSLGQGAKIPAGLNPSDEDSPIAALLHGALSGKLASPKMRRKRTKSEAQQEREQIIKDVSSSDLKGRLYCHKLDIQGLRTRRSWQELGCPATYLEAYEDRKWARYINVEKSSYAAASKMSRRNRPRSQK
jgi:hypothetical protein